MHWYINEASLQGQFGDQEKFVLLLKGITSARNRFSSLKRSLHTTRLFPTRTVGPDRSLRDVLNQSNDRDLKLAVMQWVDKAGPFIDDDRLEERDDYFECLKHDVTDCGLGEATRRVKLGTPATVFSFEGGTTNFGFTPLPVDHGLPESLLGSYRVHNLWTLAALASSAEDARPEPSDWKALVDAGRERFPRLIIPDSVYLNAALAKEPFEATIRDRALALLSHLDAYMAGRNPDGSEGQRARAVVEDYFTGGDNALFSDESATNKRDFSARMTFADPTATGASICATWHGKIRHRFFRMHFEWPVLPTATKLKVLYLGPKLTKH